MKEAARADRGDRRHKLERLSADEEHYRRIVESAPEHIFIIDRDGRIGYINRFGAHAVGMRPEDMIGRELKDIFAPEVAANFKRNIGTIFKTKKSLDRESFTKTTGREFWLDTTLTPIFDKTGRVEVVLGISRDISMRKETEAQLENSYRIQSILSRLLEIALLDIPLDEQLQLAIDIILSAPFIPLERKGGIFLVEEEQNMLVLKAGSGLPDSLLSMCARVPFGECLCGRAAAGRKLVFAGGLDERHEHQYKGMVPHGHYNIPVLSQLKKGRVLGVIVLYVRAGHERDKKEEEFLHAVANTLAGIIERKQAEQALKQSEVLSDALNSINTAISSTLDFNQIMKRVARDAAQVIGCEASAVILRERDDWIFRYTYGLPQARAGMVVPKEESKCAALAACERRTVVSEDAYHDERVSQKLMKKLGIRSFVCVPLTVKDEIIGVLDFYYRSAPLAFAQVQIDFANKLGASVSLALENARLYSVEHNIAHTLQEALLTLPEHVEGIDFGYLYRSATEAAEVGGDFFDIFELEHDRVGLVIGDVSGKGLEAATLTSLVKSAIKAYAYQGDSPATTIKKTSLFLSRVTSSSIFVTLFFAILDRNSGGLRYCAAGHPPPIIKEKAGPVRLLAQRSPVIGTAVDFEYTDFGASVAPGDFLVLYTDGATEARRGKEFFGEKRLIAFIDKTAAKSSQALVEKIYKEIRRYSGNALVDDIALMAVGRQSLSCI
ncbi:MAG: SpoIIE family protein phosphatase [Actinomycetota bacterium]|nr:SpoIIE family protein phosphatase [Actinomycetota bacterium]